jgi:hypothetical protein
LNARDISRYTLRSSHAGAEVLGTAILAAISVTCSSRGGTAIFTEFPTDGRGVSNALPALEVEVSFVKLFCCLAIEYITHGNETTQSVTAPALDAMNEHRIIPKVPINVMVGLSPLLGESLAIALTANEVRVVGGKFRAKAFRQNIVTYAAF